MSSTDPIIERVYSIVSAQLYKDIEEITLSCTLQEDLGKHRVKYGSDERTTSTWTA